MINFKAADGRRVHVQFKRGMLFIASRDGRMGPVPESPPRVLPDGRPDPAAPPPNPLVIDQITGSLKMDGDQPVLTYPNPVVQGEYIDMFIDPENVACMWSAKSVIVATAAETSLLR